MVASCYSDLKQLIAVLYFFTRTACKCLSRNVELDEREMKHCRKKWLISLHSSSNKNRPRHISTFHLLFSVLWASLSTIYQSPLNIKIFLWRYFWNGYRLISASTKIVLYAFANLCYTYVLLILTKLPLTRVTKLPITWDSGSSTIV